MFSLNIIQYVLIVKYCANTASEAEGGESLQDPTHSITDE